MLLGLGFAAALVEQAMLFPLRRLADVDRTFLPADDRLAAFGVLIVVGFVTEVLAIAILGGDRLGQAPQALLGPAAPLRAAPRRGPMLAGALLAALIAAASAWAFVVLPVPLQVGGLVLSPPPDRWPCWPLCYGLIGLATPAVVHRRLGPLRALRRSIVLSLPHAVCGRSGSGVLGYAVWFVIRLGLSLAAIGIVDLLLRLALADRRQPAAGRGVAAGQRARLPDARLPGRRAAPGDPDAHRGPRHRAAQLAAPGHRAPRRPDRHIRGLRGGPPAGSGRQVMTRWWSEASPTWPTRSAAACRHSSCSSVVAALLVALGWYFWPAWLPWHWHWHWGERRARSAAAGPIGRAPAGGSAHSAGGCAGGGAGAGWSRASRPTEFGPTSCPTSRPRCSPSPPTSWPPPGRYAEAVRERLRAMSAT